MTYLLITKARRNGAQVLLVAPKGADPYKYIAKGESMLCVAKVRANHVSVCPCRSGSAAVLSH